MRVGSGPVLAALSGPRLMRVALGAGLAVLLVAVTAQAPPAAVGTPPRTAAGRPQRTSHGCIRMSVPSVISLYRKVRIGTPVLVR